MIGRAGSVLSGVVRGNLIERVTLEVSDILHSRNLWISVNIVMLQRESRLGHLESPISSFCPSLSILIPSCPVSGRAGRQIIQDPKSGE